MREAVSDVLLFLLHIISEQSRVNDTTVNAANTIFNMFSGSMKVSMLFAFIYKNVNGVNFLDYFDSNVKWGNVFCRNFARLCAGWCLPRRPR